MKRTDSITDLIGALVKAQAEMPNAFMDAEGMDGNRTYPYATLASVIEAIRKPFANNGLCFWQCVSMTPEKAVCVETTIAHVSGQTISEQLIRTPDRRDNVKGLGSEISYLKRYAVMAMAGCAAAVDDDEIEAGGRKGSAKRVSTDKAPAPPMPTRRAAKEMVKAAEGEPRPEPTTFPDTSDPSDIVTLTDRHGNTATYSMSGEPTSIAAAIQTDLVDCAADSAGELERAWERHYRVWKRLDAEARNRLEALKDRLKARHDSTPPPARREPNGGAQV